MQIATYLSDEIARYLDLASDEAKLTAANVTNIDTPGYRAVGIDFEAEMRRNLADLSSGQPPHPVDVTPVAGLIARPDGNNV